MCFTDKIKRNWIRKEDHVPDPGRPPGRVGYGGASRHKDKVCHCLIGDHILMLIYVCANMFT